MELQKDFLSDNQVAVRFPSGKRLVIQQVSALAIQTIQTSGKDKPQPPWVEMEVRGGLRKRERNPDDPDYRAELKKWESSRGSRLMQYVLCNGVIGEPPADFADEYEAYIDIDNPAEVKMLWIGTLLNNEESEALTNAIVEMTTPTEEGIAQSEETFQDDSEQ
jgi:hypothetical protein